MLHTFICNVTEVYNVKETYNTACYLFFLKRKNKKMIKTLLLCISYLCGKSKIIDRAKIHRLLENNSCSFLSEIYFLLLLGIKMAATVLRLRGPLRFCSAQGVRSACQVKITFWDYLQSLIILI